MRLSGPALRRRDASTPPQPMENSGQHQKKPAARKGVRAMVAQSGSRVVPAQRRRSLAQRIWASRRLYLYLTPGFILLLIFNYYPPLSAIYHSFFQWDGISPPIFNGLNNFQQMLTDDDLVYAVGNLLKLLAFQMVV